MSQSSDSETAAKSTDAPATQSSEATDDTNATLAAFGGDSSSSSSTSSPRSSPTRDNRAPQWPLSDRPDTIEADTTPPEYVTAITADIDAEFDDPTAAETAPTGSEMFSVETSRIRLLKNVTAGISKITETVVITAVPSGIRLSAINSANTLMGETFLPRSIFSSYTVQPCQFAIDISGSEALLSEFHSNTTVQLQIKSSSESSLKTLPGMAHAEQAILTELGYTTPSEVATVATADLTDSVSLPDTLSETELPESVIPASPNEQEDKYKIEWGRVKEIRSQCRPKLFAIRASVDTLPEPTLYTDDSESPNCLLLEPTDYRHADQPSLEADTTAVLPPEELLRLNNSPHGPENHIQLSTDLQTLHGHLTTGTTEAHITTAATTTGGISTALVSRDLLNTASEFILKEQSPSSLAVVTHLAPSEDDNTANTDSDADTPNSIRSFPLELAHTYEKAATTAFFRAIVAPRIRSEDKTQFTHVAYQSDSAPASPPIHAQPAVPNRQPVPYPNATPNDDATYIGTINRSRLLEWFNTQLSHADEALFRVSQTGLETTVVDPANVTATRGTLNADAFNDFGDLKNIESSEITIGLWQDTITRSLSAIPEDSLVSLYCDPKTLKLTLIGAGVQQTLSGINPDAIRSARIPDNVSFTASAFLSVSQFKDAISKAATTESDAVTVTLSDGTLSVYGATQDVRKKAPDDVDDEEIHDDAQTVATVRTFEADGLAQARYNPDKLTDWLSSLEDANAKTVQLYFGSEIPILLKTDIKDSDVTTTTIIAPRISPDDSVDVSDPFAINALSLSRSPLADPDPRWELIPDDCGDPTPGYNISRLDE